MLTLSFLTLTTSIYSSPSELSTNVKSTPTSTATKPTRTDINKLKKKKKKPKPQMKIPFFKTSKLISIHRAGVLAARVTIYNFKSWPTCAWGWDEEEEMETWTNEREIFRDLSNSCVNILISFFFFFLSLIWQYN